LALAGLARGSLKMLKVEVKSHFLAHIFKEVADDEKIIGFSFGLGGFFGNDGDGAGTKA
jgi:hypothetical protein